MLKLTEKIERGVLGSCMLAICAFSLANVVCRSLLNFSLPFIEELNQFLIIAITFMGAAYGVRTDRHIRMSAVTDALSNEKRKRLIILTDLLAALVLAYLAILSIEYVQVVARLGSMGTAVRIPLAWVYSIAPVGLFLATFLYLVTAYKNFTSKEAIPKLKEGAGL